MAENNNYPQLPKAAYWSLRKFLNKRPSTALDGQIVASEINVQVTAARQYIVEMSRLGILDEDGKLTELGHEWRHDDTYRAATNKILDNCYSAGLVAVASPGEAERAKVVNWFSKEGLGTGSAGNKAATYLMLANDPILTAAEVTGAKGSPTRKPKASSSKPSQKAAQPEQVNTPIVAGEDGVVPQQPRGSDSIPLNINLQIHISADASAEQINLVFEAMRRHLYGS